MNSPLLTKISSAGGPNTTILVGPGTELQHLTQLLAAAPELDLWQFTGEDPSPEQVSELADALEAQVVSGNLKRLSLLGVSWGGPICVQYASTFPRNMRRLVMVDAKARLHQSNLEKTIEWIEDYLPLGFPLRPISKAFDPRPLLHRVRCPTLILKTTSEPSDDADFLAERIPNAWKREISMVELPALFVSFLDVQTKQPQKQTQKRANG